MLARQDFGSWTSMPVPSSSTAEPAEAKPKKKRPKANVVYSQPADTGTGYNVNTQLVYAVNHLKSVGNPMRLEELAIITQTPLDTDASLLSKFKAHDRVEYNPKTNLYSYRHDYAFRNKAQLLTEIQRSTKKGGGLSVKTLKESWKDAPSVIEELEKEGDVLVTRTAKDGQMKMVFWNEIKPDEDGGGVRVEQEFLDLWHSLVVPPEPDLLKALASEGLQATAADAGTPKQPGNGKKKGKKGQKGRVTKFTNTHLMSQGIDLTRDYVPQPK